MKYYNRNQIVSLELIKKRIHIVFSNNTKEVTEELDEISNIKLFTELLASSEWFCIEDIIEALKQAKKPTVAKPKTRKKRVVKKENKDGKEM